MYAKKTIILRLLLVWTVNLLDEEFITNVSSTILAPFRMT